jgi:hypothetical protein
MTTYGELLAKAIVFDIDDLIVEDSLIDPGFVDKLREAKDKGWYLIVFSKRGQLETNGNVDLEGRNIIFEIQKTCEWFNIPFDKIQIGKPLAAITIDNSAITTNAFKFFIF